LVYTCVNGTAQTGTPTGSTDVEQCSSCKEGYTLTGTYCLRLYTCANGTPEAGVPDASATDRERCSSCVSGHHTAGSCCAINTYTCSSGTKAVDGTPGGTHNAEYCLCAIGETTDATNSCVADEDRDGVPDTLDVDDDGDGLIEIRTLDELNNIRYNLAGTSYDDGAADSAPDGDTGDVTGCGGRGTLRACNGYELMASLDFADAMSYAADANGNRAVNTTWCPTGTTNCDGGSGAGAAGWPPIGTFTGTFNGNGNTISNLYVRGGGSGLGYLGLLSAQTVHDCVT